VTCARNGELTFIIRYSSLPSAELAALKLDIQVLDVEVLIHELLWLEQL
jgi:hypothetical protein